jgi:hypothetical protein
MKILAPLFLLTILLMAGCSSTDKKAAELLETARFEEKQGNREHSTKLYKEIIRDYAGTPAAKEAAMSMEQLKGSKP